MTALRSEVESRARRLADAALRGAAVLREAARRESRKRRMAWGGVAALLVLGPLLINLARDSSFTASVGMFPRPVGPYEAVRDPAHYRALLADPVLRQHTQLNSGEPFPAPDDVRIRVNPPGQGMRLTVRADTPRAARTLVNALGPQIAGASARAITVRAQRDLRALDARLRAPGTGRAERRALRERIRAISGLAREAPHHVLIGTRAGPPALGWADNLVNAAPGDFTPRPPAATSALAGLLVAVTLWMIGLVVVPPAAERTPSGVRAGAARMRARTRRPPPPAPDPSATAIPRPAAAIGAAALVCAGAFVLWVGREMNFLEDEWAFVIGRRENDLDAFLEPHNEHLMLVPAAAFKALFATVGIGDYWPYLLVVLLAHLLCVVLVFELARKRVGSLAAALLSAPVLAFGPGWEVLLFAINIGFLGSTVAGLGAMVALDRGTRRGDLVAAVLLAVSLASSTLGLCFALGAAVEVLWREDRRRRVWIAALPLAAYGVWYLAFNLDPDRQGPLTVLDAPSFALHAAGGALSALYGLPLGVETAGRSYHSAIELLSYLALAAAVFALVHRVRRIGVTPRLAMLVTTLLSFWLLTGVARGYSEQWYAGRYVYPGAVLILVLAAEAGRGLKLPRRALAVAAPVAILVAAVNAGWLVKDGNGRRVDAQVLSAELAAAELARDQLPGDFLIDDRRARFVTANQYFDAVDDIGSPALPAAELPAARPLARRSADALLVRGGMIGAGPAGGRRGAGASVRLSGPAAAHARRVGDCTVVRVPRGRGLSAAFTLPREGVAIRTRDPGAVRIGVRRFASAYEPLAAPAARERMLVAAPDRAPGSWSVQLSGATGYRLC